MDNRIFPLVGLRDLTKVGKSRVRLCHHTLMDLHRTLEKHTRLYVTIEPFYKNGLGGLEG